MALSNEWTEYHLTSGRWVEGSQRRDGGQFKNKPIPDDRFMTVVYKETCNGGPVHEAHKMTWESEDRALVEKLLAEFGPPPRHL